MSRELIKPTSEEAEKWERIYLAYGAQLYAYAIKTMGNQQDAEAKPLAGGIAGNEGACRRFTGLGAGGG